MDYGVHKCILQTLVSTPYSRRLLTLLLLLPFLLLLLLWLLLLLGALLLGACWGGDAQPSPNMFPNPHRYRPTAPHAASGVVRRGVTERIACHAARKNVARASSRMEATTRFTDWFGNNRAPQALKCQ